MKDPGQGAIREEETKRCELRFAVRERWRLCHGAKTMYGTSLLGYRSKHARCKAKCDAPARSDGDVPIAQKLPPRQPGSIRSPDRCSPKKAPPPFRDGRPHSRPRRSPESHSPQSRGVKRFATVKRSHRQPASECDPNLADQGRQEDQNRITTSNVPPRIIAPPT